MNVKKEQLLEYYKQKLVRINFSIDVMIGHAKILLLIGDNYNKWSMFS
jgi:hypothetical protein